MINRLVAKCKANLDHRLGRICVDGSFRADSERIHNLVTTETLFLLTSTRADEDIAHSVN
jgi:hypothetical protein